MPTTALDRRVGRSNAAARNQELIGRAAKLADWAATALASAAKDLDGACGADGNALTGLAEVVHDEAARVSNLAEEIESRYIRPNSQSDRLAPRSRDREEPPRPRPGRIIDAVTRVLSDHRQPLHAREVHAGVEMLLEEPVRWASVRATLSSNLDGAAPRFIRRASGCYSILSRSNPRPSATGQPARNASR